MSNIYPILGAGGKAGGGAARTPVEAPDSLHSVSNARILDLLSEGEIYGLVDGMKSILLDETPLQNADDSFNFKNVQVYTRTGVPNQNFIPGFPSVENTIGVNVELRDSTPYTRSFTNLSLTALGVVLSTPAFSVTNTTNGDITGYTVAYAIDIAVDGGAFTQMLAANLSGKTTSKFERTHRINLPPATSSGWILRVRRLTANASSGTIADLTYVDTVTEIIDAKLRYPSSALVGMTFDASQFNNIPTRAFHCKGLLIKVPSNYNPTTRVYTGTWDGTFQIAYSNNPAWVFYDIVLKPRYGLGRYVSSSQMDKWSLYKIAQYCDELVSDGIGGMEPRFTCNAYIQTRQDAYRVLQDLASVFRGVTYWANNAVVAVANMPATPVYTYTKANVIDGKFNYQGSGRKARHTVAIVSYNDLTDFGRAKTVYVEYQPGIARYGINETSVTAFGCTSKSQAQRVGLWTLLSEYLETDSVSFSIGLDGTFAVPGQIIRVADPDRAGKRIGGRIAAVTQLVSTTEITIDQDITIAIGDTLTVTLPTGVTATSTVSAKTGPVVTVNPKYTITPAIGSVWVTESASLVAQLFSVLGVVESEKNVFGIVALEHDPTKFAQVDTGVLIDTTPPLTQVPSKFQTAVTGLAVTHFARAGQVVSGTVLSISWLQPQGAVRYAYRYRRSDSEWSNLYNTVSTRVDIPNMFAGDYIVQVWAFNSIDVMSQATQSASHTVPDQTLTPGFYDDLAGDIADALTAANNAQATADGAVVSFWQTSPPTIGSGAGQASVGDIWFDTDDGNKIYRVVGAAWVLAADDDLANALAAAADAQSTADGKITTYFNATTPTAPTGGFSIGDLWFNSTTSQVFRWNGTNWSQRIADITSDQIAGNGNNLIWDEYSRYIGPALPTTTVAGAITKSFDSTLRAVGTSATGSLKAVTSGTGLTDGVWLGNSSTDYNIPISPNGKYIVSGFAYVGTAGHKVGLRLKDSAGTSYASPDVTIASASTWTRISFVADLSASAAIAAIMGVDANRSGVTARTVNFDGLMIEPQIGTKTTPSAWVPGAAGRQALVAIANAATAQSTADGKIDSWYQTSPPTIGSGAGQAKDGDIWFDTDDGNKIYTVVSGAWVATPDSRIATAIAAAGTAQSTADGKSTIFYTVSTSTPTATGVGDLWFQTDTFLMKRWNGSSWVDNGARLTSGQVQNGVILPYTFGDELCPNPSFETNVSSTRKTSIAVYAPGTDICDGWRVFANTGAGFVCGIDTYAPKTGTYVLFIGTAGQTIPASSSVETYIQVAADIGVKENEQYAFSAWMRWDASAALPGGMTGKVRFGCAFYGPTGSYVSEVYVDQTYATASQKDMTVPVPTGAATMKIIAYANLANANGSPTATGATPLNARFDNVSVKKISVTGNNPNLLPNTDLANGTTGWTGTGISVVKDTEAYRLQTGTVADNVTHDITSAIISLAGFAGTEVTFSAEGVNAGTLTANSYMRLAIEWFNGASSLGFSPVSNQLDNTTPTDRYSKMVVSHRAPATADGAKVYMRSRGGGLFIYRRMKLERGGIMTPYTANAEQIYGQELIYGNSNRRIGDARNMRQAQSAGVGAIASNGVITATSAGVVNVAAFTMSYGGSVTISYSAVTSAVTGLTQNVTYYIYCIDDDYTGGARTWLSATTLQAAMNAGLGVVIAGVVKVPTSGSTTPPDPSDPACPLAQMVSLEGRMIGSYVEGEMVPCWDLNVENPGIILKPVRNNKLEMAPAACLHAENGIEVEQSLSTPMQLPDGTYRLTSMMFGQPMLTYNAGKWEWSIVTDIRDIGPKLVAKIDLDDSILFAGRTAEQQVATHNIRYK